MPAIVLLATAGILAYAARDALQSRLSVHVAAAIPKASVPGVASVDERQGSSTGAESDEEAPLGPVAVQAPGWIEPAPFAVIVPALAEGVVEEVLVLEGERVEAGQVVARMIDQDARLLVRSAQAAVAERASDVERARTTLATAEAQVQVAKINADELRDEVTRKRELVVVGGVSAGEFRGIEIRLGGYEAKVGIAERVVGEAQAALKQAEATHGSALVSADTAQLMLSRMEVRSPLSGVVLSRLVEPGSRIRLDNQGTESAGGGNMLGAVLRIYDPARLQVRVDVPLADAAKVGVGTRAIVSTEALPDQVFTGVVCRVVHEANIQRNTVQFKVLLDTPSPMLKPEMLARVKLHGASTDSQRGGGGRGATPTDDDHITLLVPIKSVVPLGEGKGQVWVVDTSTGSPLALRRDITVSASSDEGFITVTSGLRLTDRVVLDPPPFPAIKDGTRLNVLGEATTHADDSAAPKP